MKTLQECKDEVAKKYQFFDWLTLEKRFARSVDTVDNLISVYYDEAAELYASQFNKLPVYGQWMDALQRIANYDGVNSHNATWGEVVSKLQKIAREALKTLPTSPGSVDVEEKKEQRSHLEEMMKTDQEFGMYDGLGDSSGDESVKEVSMEGEIAELREKLEEITFYEEEARRQIGIRDQLLEDIFYNRLKPEVIKHKIDQILNLPF